MLFNHATKIKLTEPGHKYFDQHGRQYLSNSIYHKEVFPEFDPEGHILKACARKEGLTEKEMKAVWTGKAENGTNIHNALDKYWKEGTSDPYYEFLCNSIYNRYYKAGYKQVVSEQIVFHEKELIAGTIDLAFSRNTRKPIIDIKDYKTDQRGIDFQSRDNEFLKAPFEFLPNCSYIQYCMKISSYALMVERTWGYAIGSLAIIYIPPMDHMSWYEIPVPYMKKEAELLLTIYNKKNAAVSVQ